MKQKNGIKFADFKSKLEVNMDQIAFFWVGENIEIPSILVKSIRKVYPNNDVKITHLTNMKTPNIDGVSNTIRSELSKKLMLARLEAYVNYTHNDDLTYFCDADSILLDKLNLDTFDDNYYFIKRNFEDNWLINNPEWIEKYPEFSNKYFNDVMPYYAGGMLVRNGHSFFKELLQHCKDLRENFHSWYGDQVSQKIIFDNKKFDIKFIDQNIFLKIVKKELKSEEIEILNILGTKMITFKGQETKDFLIPTYYNLFPQDLNDEHINDFDFSDIENQMIIENAKNEAELIHQQILGNLKK